MTQRSRMLAVRNHASMCELLSDTRGRLWDGRMPSASSLDCEPVALRIVLGHLRRLKLPVTDEQLNARYRRWGGDGVELSKGEILLLDRP